MIHLVRYCSWRLISQSMMDSLSLFVFSSGGARACDCGGGAANQQVPLIRDVGWCLDDVITHVTTSKLQKLLPWRSFPLSFFFLSLFLFPPKPWNTVRAQSSEASVSTCMKAKSGAVEYLCPYVSVCMYIPHPHLSQLTVHKQLWNVWFMLCGVLTSTVCWLEINGCYLQYLLSGCLNSACCSPLPTSSVRLLKAVKSACRPDVFVSQGISWTSCCVISHKRVCVCVLMYICPCACGSTCEYNLNWGDLVERRADYCQTPSNPAIAQCKQVKKDWEAFWEYRMAKTYWQANTLLGQRILLESLWAPKRFVLF